MIQINGVFSVSCARVKLYIGQTAQPSNQDEGRAVASPNLSTMTEKETSVEPSHPNSDKILYKESNFRIVKFCKV